MDQLKVIGVEAGAIVLATDSGDRFSLVVDEVLRAHLRRATSDSEMRTNRPSPRDIQAHIRSGMSAQEVAELLGARVEDVARFEGPILAEREHVVGQALAVPVLIGGDFDPDMPVTFGAAVRAKLRDAHASEEQWSAWKDLQGWTVKVGFVAGEVERDARWTFDPRKSTLLPQNDDATQLSRQGALPDGLIPRLRALDTPAPAREQPADADEDDTRLVTTPAAKRAVREAATKRAPEPETAAADTADLLEALRRRRGQREPLPGMEEDVETQPTAPIALFEAPEATESAAPQPQPHAQAHTPSHAEPAETRSTEHGRRRGRTSMPSWDQIVFGSRTDD